MSVTTGWSDHRIPAGYWFGPLGGLVPLPGIKGSLTQDGGREVVLRQSPLTGNTTARWRSGGTRTWDCSMPSVYPDEAAMLSSIAHGALGDAAHWWVTPEAAWQNLLPERASLWLDGWEVLQQPPTQLPPLARGGNVLTVDGVAVGSALPQSVNRFAHQSLPVPTPVGGGDVTASVYALAAADQDVQLRLVFTDALGNNSQTQHHTVTSAVRSGPLVRLSVTGPSLAAAGARLQLRGAAVVARPAIVWGDQVGRWTTGRGCESAVLHGLSTEVLNARRPGGLQRRAIEFTVTEVRAS